MNSKYDPELSHQILVWMKELLNEDINTSGEKDDFYETLRDGTVLCRSVLQKKLLHQLI